MSLADQFPDITKRNQPLAPFTHLRIGGPAEFLVQPRTLEDLNAVLAACRRDKVPVRMLGGGFNLLVQDDPVPGAVIRLVASPFTAMKRDGKRVTAGGGGQLFDLIAFSMKNGLGGLETLVGIRGTVGGSVRCNVGDRSGEISQTVRNVTVLTDAGKVQVRSRDELTFSEHSSDIDEPVILSVEFELEAEAARRGIEADAQGVDRPKGVRTAELPGGGAAVPQPARTDRRDLHRPCADDEGPGRGSRAERAKLELRGGAPRHDRARYSSIGGTGANEGEGTDRRSPRTGVARLVKRARKPTLPTPSPPASSVRNHLARRVFVAAGTAGLVVAMLFGVARLGDLAQRNIGPRDRYAIPFAAIRCDAPPGTTREQFLAEVRYHANAAATVQMLAPDLQAQLKSIFESHPWVASVDAVAVDPSGAVSVKLTFRSPALAVNVGEGKRVVDANGILLPATASAAGLPELLTPVGAPGKTGAAWPDDLVIRAASVAAEYRPKSIERIERGWELIQPDGTKLVVGR